MHMVLAFITSIYILCSHRSKIHWHFLTIFVPQGRIWPIKYMSVSELFELSQ